MHKNYGQIYNFISYYIIYVDPNFLKPLSPFKDPFGLNLFLLKLKTENWKHFSKIIFKCVNSTMGPIFNIFKYVNSARTVHEQ